MLYRLSFTVWHINQIYVTCEMNCCLLSRQDVPKYIKGLPAVGNRQKVFITPAVCDIIVFLENFSLPSLASLMTFYVGHGVNPVL